MLFRTAVLAVAFAAPAFADDPVLPPFDFSDAFYLANGINPATLVGRPVGVQPNSIIDNRENGPNFGNVRLRQHTAAYDHSGHPIFFTVTGLPNQGSFTNNAAGQHALEVAETYNVYEFPQAANPPFAVFPKRQDLVADLRNGYFSHNPLGVWKINIVRFTPAATGTPAGQQTLAALVAQNGTNLDGTPIIRTIDQIESLRSAGLVTIEVPPMDGSAGFRWFFCPVPQDPRNGFIAPDAFLEVIPVSTANEHIALFDCLRLTGDDHCSCPADADGNGNIQPADVSVFVNRWSTSLSNNTLLGDFDHNRAIQPADVAAFVGQWFAAVQRGGC